MDITQTLLQKYAVKSAGQVTTEAGMSDEQLSSYLEAAALLHCFIPARLNPLDDSYIHPNPFLLLQEDITAFSGGFAEGLYTLRPAARNKALKTFASLEKMLEGLKANPDRVQTPLQDMWEDYLENGRSPKPDEMPYSDLLNLHELVTWLEGIDTNLPEKGGLLELIKRKSVLANFEHLVIDNFTGREKEVELLRNHITKPVKMPILFLHGPGGIGKSALVGKTLYEKAMAGEKDRLPYAYLAFDQPSLRIEKPATIFNECASQFELQYPNLSGEFDHFKNSIHFYSSGRLEHNSRATITETRLERLNLSINFSQGLVRSFANLLNTVVDYASKKHKEQRNILLTFDTFEEVQYRDRESLSPFINILDTLIRAVPGLRILIASRIALSTSMKSYMGKDSFSWQEMPLNDLDMEDRLLLLSRLGIKDAAVAEMVAQRVGGNPLSLRLAARVVADAQDAGYLEKAIPKQWLLSQIDEQLIQGQLYKRVLKHIHDEDVRKLAHPGMILRKVTPELILEVLAPVCAINVQSKDKAKELFDELQQEHALVQLGEFDTLKYRPEIREIMVKLLKQDKPEEVSALHGKAIDYYFDKKGVEARAEELYHRLALGDDEPNYLDRRWISGVEQSLASTLSEYSDTMIAWLASRMSLEVPREVFQNASAEQWERNITRKVKRALLNMEIASALNLLKERTERSASSPLYALEAKAHLLINDIAGADAVLEKGIERVSASINRGRLAELYWLKSQIAVMKNNMLQADKFLQQAQLAIEQAENTLTLVHILSQRLLLHHYHQVLEQQEVVVISSELNKACLRLNKNQKSVPVFIISLVIAFLKESYPATAARLTDYFPLAVYNSFGEEQKNMLVNENLRGLEKYRERWEGGDDDKLDEETTTFL